MSIPITKHVYQLSSVSGAGLWGGNVFLLAGNRLNLVDTGYKGGASRILREVRRLGYAPSDIASIIITHHHADHVGNLAALKSLTPARAVAHAADVPFISGRVPRPGPVNPRWLKRALAPFRRLWTATPAEVDILVDDGDELPAPEGARVLHTPGHTPGSICLFWERERVVIAGDLLNNRLGLGLPSKAFTVDMTQDIRSIDKLASLDFDIMCFGHGPPLIGNARATVLDFAKRLRGKRRKSF
jgi:glyoxylase-like metal-dependent hydrolase (beta-lactamase superfamily II)